MRSFRHAAMTGFVLARQEPGGGKITHSCCFNQFFDIFLPDRDTDTKFLQNDLAPLGSRIELIPQASIQTCHSPDATDSGLNQTKTWSSGEHYITS